VRDIYSYHTFLVPAQDAEGIQTIFHYWNVKFLF